MRTLLLLLTLFVVLVASASAARADDPLTVPDPLRYARATGPALSVTTLVGTASRWARASARPNAAPLCVKFGSLPVLAVSGEVSCAWTMTTTATLGTQDSQNACFLSDLGTNTADDAACNYVPGAGRVDSIPWSPKLRFAIGARRGMCTGPVVYRGLDPVYPPCRIDADCADAGASGPCNLSPPESAWASSCAFLVCRASAADTQVTVELSQ